MKKRFSKILGVAVTLAMLGSLIVAPMAGAVSSASVILSNGVISQASNYTLTFDVIAEVPNDTTGFITIQFPIGTAIAALADGDITIQSTAGFGLPNDGLDVILAANVTLTAGTTLAGAKAVIDVQDLTNDIGEGATVRIKFLNTKVTNPSGIAADYTLTIKTSETGDTTAVASQAYALTAPVVPALPGIVEVYNPTGILMASNTGPGAIQNSLDAAGVGFTIKIGPGTYDEDPDTGFTGMTIVSSSSAADTVIAGFWTVDQASTTISNLTLLNEVGDVANPTVNVTGDKSVITGCVFTKAGSAYTAVAEAAGLLLFNVAAPTGFASVSGSTFDTTLGNVLTIGALQDSALIITQNGVSVTDCTFTVDATLAGAGDTAITINGGVALLPVVLTGVTVTGSSGIGIQGTSGLASITGATLDTLDPAMNLVAGIYTMTDSTITNSGTAVSVLVALGRPAINIADAGAPPTLSITNSSLTGNLNDILEVDATGSENPNLITLMWNDLSGNALGIDNNNIFTVGGTVNAMVNWWGANTGPAAAFNGGLVNASGALGNLGATGSIVQGAAATALLTSTTYGVNVEPQTAAGAAWVPVAGDVIAVGLYTTNPEEATPQPALAGGIYDVFFSGATAPNNVLIKFFNPNITVNTVVMVWSDLQGAWSNCSAQGVNLFSGFIWVNVTGTSIPSILNLSGTPFALVEPAAVVPVAAEVQTPTFGNMAAAVQPTFTWTAVAGATSYEFVLAEEIGQDDPFAIIDYSATTDINGHVAREQLKYDTVYNWRVRAVNAVGPGPWINGFFTTVAEPEPEPVPVPPVVIKETPPTPAPEIILNVPPATKQDVQVIPDYLLWVVIAVGAVLIIAVVVLIVRTRRVT